MGRHVAAAFLAVLATAGNAFAHGADPADEESSFGRAGDASRVQRTVEVTMTDRMRFEPDVLRVRAGETVRIVAHDAGQQAHEFVLGTMKELREHAELMRRFPNMVHAEPNMTRATPGQSATIVWEFTHAGEFYFACLVPGHFEAGMIGKVLVTPN